MRHEASKEIIKRLENEGWYLSRKGRVTVLHPKSNVYGDTLRSIYRQAG